MDKELDEKLTNILFDADTDSPSFELQPCLEQIKASFKEVGYIKVPRNFKSGVFTVTELSRNGRENHFLCTYGGDPVLSGQEWLTRFTKELEGKEWMYAKGIDGYYTDDINDAARRAAGVEG